MFLLSMGKKLWDAIGSVLSPIVHTYLITQFETEHRICSMFFFNPIQFYLTAETLVDILSYTQSQSPHMLLWVCQQRLASLQNGLLTLSVSQKT